MKAVFRAIVILGFAVATTASATTPEYIEIIEKTPLEMTLSVGAARQTGYLTDQESVGAYTMGVNMRNGGGMMSFEWNFFAVDHNTNEFGLNNNKSVRISTFSFLPQLRVFERQAWSAYVGIGLAQVSLSQSEPDYKFSYGTFILSALVNYQLTERWSAHFKTQWYDVRQTVNGQETGFEVWNNVLGVGWMFR